VDETAKDALARNAFQTLVDVVYVLSNADFQQAVWVLGNHSKRYVGNYDETMEMFQENLEWLLEGDIWRRVPVTLDQISALRELYSRVETFDDRGKRGIDAGELVSDKAWPAIMSSARDTLAKLISNTCGVRPSIA